MINYPQYVQTSPYLVKKPADENGNEFYYSLLKNKLVYLDDISLEIMKYCKNPINIHSVLEYFGERSVQDALYQQYIFDTEKIWDMTNVEMMDIEITSHCNYRCRFCPESVHAKPKESMSMELFEEILQKAERHPSLKFVTFNFFNEPTLDPLFNERVKYLEKTNLKLILHTNASFLDEEKINLLKETGVVNIIQINFPSLDEIEYQDFTGSFMYKKVINNIENLARSGLKMGILINGTKAEIARNLPKIKSRFDGLTDNVYALITTDKAGYMQNEYRMALKIKSKLCGCRQVIQNVFVGIHGEMMLCCNDYDKNVIIGNIKDGELYEILQGEKARFIRKKIFGEEDSKEDFICRRCWDMKINQMYRGLSPEFFL